MTLGIRLRGDDLRCKLISYRKMHGNGRLFQTAKHLGDYDDSGSIFFLVTGLWLLCHLATERRNGVILSNSFSSNTSRVIWEMSTVLIMKHPFWTRSRLRIVRISITDNLGPPNNTPMLMLMIITITVNAWALSKLVRISSVVALTDYMYMAFLQITFGLRPERTALWKPEHSSIRLVSRGVARFRPGMQR